MVRNGGFKDLSLMVCRACFSAFAQDLIVAIAVLRSFRSFSFGSVCDKIQSRSVENALAKDRVGRIMSLRGLRGLLNRDSDQF